MLVLGGIAAGLGSIARRWGKTFLQEDDQDPAGNILIYPNLNCRLIVPDRSWLQDLEVKQGLKALLALRRSSADSWFVFFTRDYKERTPRDGEVRDEAIRRLSDFFKDSLEWEPGAATQLAGLPAQRLVFRGQTNAGDVSGECLMLAHRGIAYWLVLWATIDSGDQSRNDFEQFHRRFSLLKERDHWSEKRLDKTFRGEKADYVLQDRAGIWQEWSPATDFDREADLALVAREKDEPADGPVAATVLVLILKAARADPKSVVEVARAHLEQQHKVDYPETTSELLTEKGPAPEGLSTVGKEQGQLVRLLVKNGETRHRFVLLGIVPQPDFLLVVQCECDWKRRSLWESDLIQLLNSLRLRTK